MKPKASPAQLAQGEFFKAKLSDIMNPKHPLAILARSIDWKGLKEHFGAFFDPKTGAPALPVRLMIGLEYLKQTFKLSDELVLEAWLQNPYYQYFCGGIHFEHQLSCNSSSMTRWQKTTLLKMQHIAYQWLFFLKIVTFYTATAKGKSGKKYEFGCKVSIATTAKTNWVVGAKAFHGNPTTLTPWHKPKNRFKNSPRALLNKPALTEATVRTTPKSQTSQTKL